MSRASFTYLLMTAALVAGLWAILQVGSGLTAPTDFAGTWEITDRPRAGYAKGRNALGANGVHALGRTMHVEQSGRFFRLQFDGGLRIDLKLTDESPRRAGAEAGDGRDVAFHLAGGEWRLTGRGRPRRDVLDSVLLAGPVTHTFSARRVARTYPPPLRHGHRGVVRVPEPPAVPESPATAGAAGVAGSSHAPR